MNYYPTFHIANIQSLVTKTVDGKKIPFLKNQEKIPFLREQCMKEKTYFLGFAETYLKEGIKEAEYSIEGYSHITSHRPKREGGGVIIYINNNLTYHTLITTSDDICSLVGIYINELKLIVFMVYRPPPNYKNEYHGEILEKSFENIVINNIYRVMKEYTAPVPDILLAGDFNFPNANWSNGIGRPKADTALIDNPSQHLSNGTDQPNADTVISDNSLQQLIDVAANLNLLQKVTQGTRVTRKGNENTLELIFTNNHELISNIYVETSKITDHKYIVCETSYSHSIDEQKPEVNHDINLSSYNYLKADWKSIKSKLNEIKWLEILEKYNTSEEKLNIILEIITTIIEEHCPKFKHEKGANRKNIPRDRCILLRRKKKLRAKLLKKNVSVKRKDTIEKSIVSIDQELLSSLKNQRINEESQAIENMKTKPKHFFSFAKKYIKTKSTIGPFKINNKIITNLLNISRKLSEQYSSSFSIPDPNFSIENPREFFRHREDHSRPQLVDIIFTKQDFEKEISNIKSDSAAGPDHFPVILLKECGKELSEPLYILWRHSLDKGDIALLLRKAIVCPIQKPNTQRNHPKSYRPVSLTSHIIKIFERVLRRNIVNFLQANDLLPNNQHGFIAGRSTLSQLLNHVEEIIRAWEDGKVTDTIYLDFAKAFDKVDHGILCHKLKKLGITGKVGLWINCFLTGRTQQIAANGVLSEPAPVISGVPQGSVLGPILFIIMISDLGRDLSHSTTSKYADDTKATARIANSMDSQNFQLELNEKIYPWAPINNMTLNGDKFEHLQVGKNLKQENYSYKDPSGNTITEKKYIKDLGVFLTDNLSWVKQINEVVAEARLMSGWTLRTFCTRDKNTVITIWNSQIRPILHRLLLSTLVP